MVKKDWRSKWRDLSCNCEMYAQECRKIMLESWTFSEEMYQRKTRAKLACKHETLMKQVRHDEKNVLVEN